jgi:hypothetical protein
MKNYAATTNLEGKPILLEYGTEGYYELSEGFDIETFNKGHGVTEEDIKVMTAGSMFGWDIPAVTMHYEKTLSEAWMKEEEKS